MYMKNKNFFWGIVFILAAVFTLFGSLGYFSHVNTTKLLLTFLFLYIIVKNIPTRNFYGILIPAAFILIMYDHYLFFAGFSRFSILAAAILGSIGLSFLFPSQPRIAFDGQNEFQGGISSSGSCNESVVTCSVSFAASILHRVFESALNIEDLTVPKADIAPYCHHRSVLHGDRHFMDFLNVGKRICRRHRNIPFFGEEQRGVPEGIRDKDLRGASVYFCAVKVDL